MDYTLLVAYYELIEFCRRNGIYNGDRIIFVSERAESLCVRLVSFIDDEYADNLRVQEIELASRSPLLISRLIVLHGGTKFFEFPRVCGDHLHACRNCGVNR
jgi:hypothetical protein